MKPGGRFGRLTSCRPARGKRGTTLIFALVVLAVAAMVLAGTVIVMGALVEHTVAAQTATNRRLQLENSRAMAVQFIRERVFSGTLPEINGVTNTSVTSGAYALGGIAVPGIGTSAWTVTNRPAGPNPFSPGGDTLTGATYRSGYTTNMAATLYHSSGSVAWNFEARSRTPTLGYDLANYVGTGTAASVASAASIGATNATYVSGTALNAAFLSDLALTGTGFAAAVAGAGTAIDPSGTLTNSEYRKNNGTVTIFLNGVNAANTLYVSGSLNSLVFDYSGTYGVVPGFPLRVVCSGLTASATVNFNAGSFRPVYLIYSSTRPVTINHTSAPRLTTLFINAPVTIQSGTIVGGIRASGGSISVSGGTLNIVRETDPGTLDDVAIRRGWVESYRND